MGELGDLLELLHAGGPGDRPVRATLSTWTDPALSHEAFLAAAEEEGAAVFTAYAVETAAEDDDDEAPEAEELLRLWRAPPDRVRAEVWRGDQLERVVVRAGRTWWDYDGDEVVTNEDDLEVERGTGGEHHVLFEPARLMASLVLEHAGSGEVAGRPALLAVARPRPVHGDHELSWVLHEIGAGADEWELAVDAELGVLLRVEARRGGRTFRRVEVRELAVGEPLDEALFTFAPPEGAEVRGVRDEFPIDRDLRLDELARRAPFTVFAPDRLGPAWELDASLLEGRGEPTTAYLHLHSEDGHWAVAIEEVAAADADDGTFDALDVPQEWVTVERGGRSIAVREPSERWARSLARVELEGTRVTLSSDGLDAERLAELAARLVPAPDAPPPF